MAISHCSELPDRSPNELRPHVVVELPSLEQCSMSSLISRSIVLASARFLSQGLLMLSPILLVRLLDIEEYGWYRQFTVTAVLLIAIGGFSINGSVNYFVARLPEKAPRLVTNSCLLLLLTSLLVVVSVIVAHQVILPQGVRAYWPLLACYVFLYVNVDIIQSYLLARKESFAVMVYSVGQVVLRLSAVVGAAAWFGDVAMIFISMIVVESVQKLGQYAWLQHKGLLIHKLDAPLMQEQLHYIVPVGIAVLVASLNENVGKLLVGSVLGPTALAIFTTAAYQIPVLTILKSALGDVIFPDMVQRSDRDPTAGLRLWQRANVVYFLFVCPVWMLLTYYAEPVIRLLFTEQYVAATPYFQAMLLLMIRHCFEFSTPLRSVGRTKAIFVSNTTGMLFNLLFTWALLSKLKLWAPTLGLLISQLWIMVFLAVAVRRRFKMSVAQALKWRALARILLSGVLALISVLAIEQFGSGSVTHLAALAAFAAIYLVAVRLFRVEEFNYVVAGVTNHFTGSTRRPPT